jgi:hypothetical protein
MAERFRPYALSGLLPEGHHLVLDTARGVLSQISDECQFVEQQLLTVEELSVIAELLASYPYHAPDAMLLSVKTQEDLKLCQKKVNMAYEMGTWDAVLRPVRNLMSRCRLKLHPFGIDARSVVQTGYILMPLSVVLDRRGRWPRQGA